MQKEIDLFEQYALLPDRVQKLITTHFDGNQDYTTCKVVLREMKKLGYTFDFGLDAEPYNLRKI